VPELPRIGPHNLVRAPHHQGWQAGLVRLLLLGALATSAAGCRVLPVDASVYGIPADRVRVEVEELPAQPPAQLAERARAPDIDGTSLLSSTDCPDGCQAAIVTLYIENPDAEPMPPPVLRIDAPPGKPERLPVAFRGLDISPGRIGRIRVLVALWPGEAHLRLRLSSSVRIEATTGRRVQPPVEPFGATQSSQAPGRPR
jgi:hypothetical protein